MKSIMDIVVELLTESTEFRNDSQSIRNTEIRTIKGFSQELQNSQARLAKKQIATGYGCAGCGCKTYELIASGWQCNNCKTIYEFIGGTRGPVVIQ